ncbi:Aspartyl/glutamyl-tRNA(Asn/Gln) amidotransferase subunit B [Rhodococcus sp. AW25M09]|uniref:hypothetical protein n=1 Tax=Rhodococcus sp. AW25M09 TaxID=1268303 RepID=UPI0002AC4215|nr:hypothetical protein [Rhodococcus sp. AW25M09]CCQ15932.1 Aspartyl/glutamyl-tRNA(Asn/Gln) amidotransferase subunit B [Rhodococcus sp. AW25M09]
MTASRKLYEHLRAGLDTLSAEQREQIRLDPGTSAHEVDDRVEFVAAGITYATVDRSFFDAEVEWIEFVDAHTE